MRFSRKVDYGLILLEALRPSFQSKEFMPLSEVARKNRLPLPFLEKLADLLRRAGFVEARRGAAGGYRLIRDPEKITLKEAIDVFEEPKMMRCLHSSHPEKYCSLVKICPTRKTWRLLEERVTAELERITVAEL